MVATREIQFCIGGSTIDLHSGQHTCVHTTCVSSLRGERDLCNLHTGHGSDALTTILYWRKKFYVTYILDNTHAQA